METNNTETTTLGFTTDFHASNQNLSYVLTTMSLIIVVIDSFSVFILGKCKRIPRHCLYLIISLIISDIVNSAVLVIHQIIIFTGVFNKNVYYSRNISLAVPYNITAASVAMLTLERVFALKFNLRYSAFISTFKTKLFIFILWSLYPGIILISIAAGIMLHCSEDYINCDHWKAIIVPRVILAIFPVLCYFISLYSNITISRIVRRHVQHINNAKRATFNENIPNTDELSDRQYAAAGAIVQISLAYLVLHSPIIINFALSQVSTTMQNSDWSKYLMAFIVLCMHIHSFMNLFVIVFKLSECRMHVFYFFARCSTRCKSRADRMRIDIYDIVISTKPRNNTSLGASVS